ERAKPVDATVKGNLAEMAKGKALSEFMHFTDAGIQCRCGWVLTDTTRNFKDGTVMEEGWIKEAGPYVNQFDVAQRFVFRQFYCPSCLTRLETEICLKDEPVLHDVEVRP